MDERRIFTVTPPPMDMESMIPQIPFNHDGPHLEMFYNLIFADLDWHLPDHLRPVAWALADKNIRRLMVIISPGAGKSQLMDIAFPVYELGHNQNTTILGVSSGADLMVDFLKASMTIIEENKVCRLLFPHLRPDMAQGWSATSGAFVKRTVTGQASPSYAATGYGAKKITGKHAKFLVIDDIHDEENCLDDQTEVLTKRGWLYFSELTYKDEIATRNPQTHKFEWQLPINLIQSNFNGDMYHFNSRGLDLMTTPNHRMIVAHRISQKSEYILKAEELATKSDRCLPVTSKWKGKAIRNFILKAPNCKTIIMSGDNYCAFMGMYLSEGSTKGDRTIQISQKNYSKGYPKFKELIARIFGRNYFYTGNDLTIPSKPLNMYLQNFGLSLTKSVPQVIKDATPRQIEIFLKYYSLGDGHLGTSPDGTYKDELYTSSKKMADDLQELYQKVGYYASIKTREWNEDKIICGRLVKAENCHNSYTITRHISKFSHDQKDYISVRRVSKVPYKGKVYCASVPNGSLYVRRNGYAAWVGNSSTPDQLDKVENFYYKTLIGRQDPGGSRMIMVGRRWDEQDLYGRLKDAGDWLVMTLASIREDKVLYYDARIPANLPCVFNNFTATPKVEDIKVVYGENDDPVQRGFYWKGMGDKFDEAIMNKKNKPDIFETVYQSNPESAGKKIFKVEDFVDFELPQEMYLGRNYDVVSNWLFNMQFDSIIETLDTALTDETKNDPSCCYVLGLKGCVKEHKALDLVNAEPTEVPFHFDIYVLDELFKHLFYDDLQPEIVDYFNKWLPEKLLIEKANVGIPLLNSLASYSIPVEGVIVQHTSKRGRAINGAKAGSVQGWARLGRIYIPKNAMWSEALLNELKDFTGARNKRDDRVDALIQGVNYAIDLGVLSRDLPPGWTTKEEIDAKLLSWMAPNHPLLQLPHMYGNINNPFYGMCGTCKKFDQHRNYCNLHKRNMPRLGSCPMYDSTEESIFALDGNYGRTEEHKN